MTVRELRSVLGLAKNENVEITFSTKLGLDFDIHSFFDDGEIFQIILNTPEWREREV